MNKLLLGISGGIAAYKSIQLVRLLKQQDYEVRCVLTESAQTFVTPQTLQALTGEIVRTDLFDAQAEAAMGHIELARWADCLIIAPATANTLAKLANGIADNLLTTVYLATNAPILLAPAMNHQMWQHPATQENCQRLQARENHFIIPVGVGEQACGEVGAGRMAEPETIIEYLNAHLNHDWTGIHLTLTAGPTREPIDPVRYISNHSSGKMGYQIAAAAARRGAKVTLISGPTALPTPTGVKRINVNTALEMHQAALTYAPQSDIFIGVAAVADYRVENPANQKQKKNIHGIPTLTLIENPDIITDVAALKVHRPYTVGFAAETENLLTYARDKRQKKQLDLIIANDVSENVFGADENSVTLISAEAEISLPCQAKAQLADTLLTHILQHYRNNHAESRL